MKYIQGEKVKLISGAIVTIEASDIKNKKLRYLVSNKNNYKFLCEDSYIKCAVLYSLKYKPGDVAHYINELVKILAIDPDRREYYVEFTNKNRELISSNRLEGCNPNKKEMENIKFYMIYGENTRNSPVKKHLTLQDAINKAERLAKLNPNTIFYILQSYGEVKANISITTNRVMY